MFKSAIVSFSIFFSLTSSANIPDKNYFSRMFRKLPISEAHETFGKACDRELDSKSISVLVWNIKKTEMKPWKAEFNEYSRGKDLFLIQEAYDNELFEDTLKSFECFRWDMGKSFAFRKYEDRSTGTMVGASAEPEEVIVTHTPDNEPITKTPKALTFAKYGLSHSEKSLLVISVHAINFREFGPFKRNMLQAKAEIDKHDGPVLFAGDFNTHLKSRTKYLMNLMKEMNFTEINFINGHQRMKAAILGSYLDHGFVRGLSVKHAEVLGKARGSDHRPMTMELSLEEESLILARK